MNERQALLDKLEPKVLPPNSKIPNDLASEVKHSNVVSDQPNLKQEEVKSSQINEERAKTQLPAVTSKLIPEDSKVLPGDVKDSKLINEQEKNEEDLPDVPPEEGAPSKIFTHNQSKFLANTKASKVIPPEDRKSRIAQSNVLPAAAAALNLATQPATIIPKTSQIKPPISTITQFPGIAAQTSFTNQVGENIATQTEETSSKVPPASSIATQPIVSRVTDMPPSVVQPSGVAPKVSNVVPQSFDAPQQTTDFPKAPSSILSAAVNVPSNAQPSVTPLETSKVAPIQTSNVINEENKEVAGNAKSAPLFEVDPSSQLLLGYKNAVSCTYLIPSLDSHPTNLAGGISPNTPS
jgi:hypothetical protein